MASLENSTGRIYWLTGLSGAGKTTIGRLWYEKLKTEGENVVFLDGDELRQVFGDGYFEVYIKVTEETLRRRDQKGLYSTARQDVAGLHVKVEEPKRPDMILVNDGAMTPEEQISVLQSAIKNVKE